MNRDELVANKTVGRRALLGSVAAFAGVVAGCSQLSPASSKENRPAENKTSKPSSSDIQDANTRLEYVSSEIESVPVVDENGELAFDTDAFEGSFDHERLFETVKDIRDSFEGQNTDRANELVPASRLLYSRIELRLLLNDVFASGTMYQHMFMRNNYGAASKHAEEALEALDYLPGNADTIEHRIDRLPGSQRVNGEYSTEVAKMEAAMAAEIYSWAVPAYRGLRDVSTGMKLVSESQTWEMGERSPDSPEHYTEISERFSSAKKEFNEAHGSGTPIPRMVPVFDDLRCFASDMDEVMADVATAAELSLEERHDESQRIREDALRRAEQNESRCLPE
ncbi:uncharacterized protein NP_2818A [Natronomonas pharaonis DSM 2160]|uniref:Uncharacterized protein n=1 Tax=Natronomonas pharaonis (strain ATCC 35678 / DSM 2160 / CIP 103997 / JCM 8858 / NBRC 14720 / NCIMB 2260 / Gabara) TaxID=348780 RepID=A0A1U7EWM8_NATPD|nr:hypothetical protein [Natronomonas pharaonis]CAI49500.1 uncharacterized protein NP_2818A [Natronomonas pharaonis DSM 2160]